MTGQTILHGSFTLARSYAAAPHKVFRALADPEARMRWGAPSNDEELVIDRSDFRVGGTETSRCGPRGNLMFQVVTNYLLIETDRHIVFSEKVSGPDGALSAALLTFELLPEGAGTRLTLNGSIAALAGSAMIDGARNGFSKALENLVTELGCDQIAAS